MHVLAEEKMSIPHLFRCPISLDLFTDPVTLITGQTYDRPSIEKWLACGNVTCPVTMQPLADATLIPNHNLRHLIDRWLLAGPSADCQRIIAEPSADLSLLAFKDRLQSSSTRRAEKLESLSRIRTLSLESDTGRDRLIQLGFFPLLLNLLFQASATVDAAIAEALLESVLGLSATAPLDQLNVLKEDAKLAAMIILLEQGTPKIKKGLCHLLEMIASSSANQDLCVVLGRSRRVLRVLVSLLHTKSEAAVRAMAGMCATESNRGGAIREGAVDGLLFYVSHCARRHVSHALATLELLVGVEAGKEAVVNPGAIEVMVGMIFRVSGENEGSEHALGVLLGVCGDSERARAAAVEAGAVRQVLLLLQSQCGAAAKSKGRALLKMLRASWSGKPESIINESFARSVI